MPKRKNGVTTKQLNVIIPEDLWLKVKILLADPRFGRTKYGAMSNLIERLLRDYIKRIERGEEPIIDIEDGVDNASQL